MKQRFCDFLMESGGQNRPVHPWMIATAGQIKTTLHNIGLDDRYFSVSPDLEVSFNSNRPVDPFGYSEMYRDTRRGRAIRINIDDAGRTLELGYSQLSTMKGFPRKVSILNLDGNEFTSFDNDVMTNIGEFISIVHNKSPISLKGIHEKISFSESGSGILEITPNFTGGLLDVLKIGGLKRIDSSSSSMRLSSKQIRAVDIVNVHLKEKDLIACKRELISAGFGDLLK